MQKIKSLIIEDNAFLLTVLSDILKENHPELEVLDTATNGKDGLNKINQLKPDLVFLDIEMPDMNGFEMLKKLDRINFQTIFTTAHSHYAIKAFRFNALDYLVKPIVPKELKEAINRFKSNISANNNQNLVKQALDNLVTEKVEDQILLLPSQQGAFSLKLKQIIRIEGERNYSYIFLSNGKKQLSSKTLGYFDEILSDKGFLRCHRSHLINGIHIEGIQKNESFVLKDKSIIPISRRKKTEAKSWFQHFMNQENL